MVNTMGRVLKLTSFGESHGNAVGAVIDGCPPGIRIDMKKILLQLKRRSAASGDFSSGRKEADQPEFLSGIDQGLTLGTPIAFIVRNADHRPEDYKELAEVFRPSHADFSWFEKFGMSSGPGGGRSSARALVPLVIAGCIAEQIIDVSGFSVMAWVSAVGPFTCDTPQHMITPAKVQRSPLACPDAKTTKKIEDWLLKLKAAGDTAGGVISCRIHNCPAGIGEPVFGKLHADLASAMMGINSVKAFELGKGTLAGGMTGSEYNDAWEIIDGVSRLKTNHDGGINGGISNGEDINFRLTLKPVPSIKMTQQTLTRNKKPRAIKISGRHDCCVLPRAVPIVESLASFVLADHYLMQKMRKGS